MTRLFGHAEIGASTLESRVQDADAFRVKKLAGQERMNWYGTRSLPGMIPWTRGSFVRPTFGTLSQLFVIGHNPQQRCLRIGVPGDLRYRAQFFGAPEPVFGIVEKADRHVG